MYIVLSLFILGLFYMFWRGINRDAKCPNCGEYKYKVGDFVSRCNGCYAKSLNKS